MAKVLMCPPGRIAQKTRDPQRCVHACVCTCVCVCERQNVQKRLVPKVNSTLRGVNCLVSSWHRLWGEKGPSCAPALVLTLGVLAFTGDPEVQQGHALLQQGVGVLHADPVDVLHAELQFPGQLCMQGTKSRVRPAGASPEPTCGAGRPEGYPERHPEIEKSPLWTWSLLPKDA